ncbi:malonate decarboxylase subunit alpha [Telmatospirillum sp.]|uniref:acyl CoA:acetate/3-ketoacid CoA transferase n=1 Tax=Telmatospirillum sp. TaxID=2079197 RepID=UPI00283E3B35|nr:malonate decarboxylase subunit alpha [Telmatospirillum sp.]MDR3440741.1 malonate decarboxylase subunit alpha [Telmatospirillum sp.]
MRVISAQEAAALVQDHWTVVPGGFGSCGHPDVLTRALGERFARDGSPRDLTLLFAAGAGDKAGRGLDALARAGLVRRAIGGFWGLAPSLCKLVRENRIEAHNWPQGVISQMFRATASGAPGLLSRTGLETFVDPDESGGCMNSITKVPLVKKMRIGDEPFLFFPRLPIDCALIRGTRADKNGNISTEREVSFTDSLSQATAARNSGGIVIAQVEELVENGDIQPHAVRVPGVLVDYVVVAEPTDHPQTYGTQFDPKFVSPGPATPSPRKLTPQHLVVARRAAEELRTRPGALVNLGIGMPAAIGQIAAENCLTDFTLTVESGQIGGIPAADLSFGASTHPQAVLEQSALFDLYDGGGLDIAFLGFAEADSSGNVNVSRFADRMPGAGGFINISQSARSVVFCGSFTTDGLRIEVGEGRLDILSEGRTSKFVPQVSHVTFNGQTAARRGQSVTYVTERAVFSLVDGALHLIEVAPGVDVDEQIIPFMSANLIISPNCREMDTRHFI